MSFGISVSVSRLRSIPLLLFSVPSPTFAFTPDTGGAVRKVKWIESVWLSPSLLRLTFYLLSLSRVFFYSFQSSLFVPVILGR